MDIGGVTMIAKFDLFEVRPKMGIQDITNGRIDCGILLDNLTKFAQQYTRKEDSFDPFLTKELYSKKYPMNKYFVLKRV